MRGYSLGALLSAVLLFGNCQKQAFLFRPTAATRTSEAAVAREPLEPAAEATAMSVPELTAQMPVSAASSAAAEVSSARLVLVQPTTTAKPPLVGSVQLAASQIVPDTALVRSSADTPLHKIKETDLFTKLVRVVGVLLFLAAIALFITAFTTTSAGWTAFAFLLYGSTVLLMSIPFFIFRGKDSPRRQELERRRAARKAAAGR